jgi:hypothetical protein
MEDNMEVITARPPLAAARQPIRRIIAHMLRKAGASKLIVDAMGKDMRHDAYLAIMLWDLVTTGEAYFADGKKLKIEDPKDWLDIVKFMSAHIDGPQVHEGPTLNVNVYKVYTNVEEDRV